MWIKSSGELTENVLQVVTPVTSHLLFIGEDIAFVDASVAAMSGHLIEQLETFLGSEPNVDYFLITHAHFDHVGALPQLRKRYPDAEIIASPQTAELLNDPEVKKDLFAKNVACAEALGIPIEMPESEWAELLTVTRILGEGDAIDLGADVEIKLIACPGHTSDSVAYFVQPDAALACAESAGSYDGRDKVYNCFTENYDEYVNSLGRLSGLDVKVLGFPHVGALTGEMIPKFFQQAQQEAERFRSSVKERIEQGEIIDEIFASLLPEWQSQNISPEGPFVDSQKETLRGMIKAVAASLES